MVVLSGPPPERFWLEVVGRGVGDAGAVGNGGSVLRGRDDRDAGRREAAEQAACQVQGGRGVERHGF